MNEDIQKKYMEYQQLNQQIQQMQQQLQNLDKQSMDLAVLMEALDDIKKASVGKEVLAPLGSGLYLRTKLERNDEIIMHVGSSTNVSKTPEEARKIIENQREELKKIMGNMKSNFQNAVMRVQELQKELAHLQQPQ